VTYLPPLPFTGSALATMRLADFILKNLEPILAEWEAFALSIWPESAASTVVLRDHAEEMLVALAKDMKTAQTDAQQSDKSKGHGEGAAGEISDKVDSASNLHALARLTSGFGLRELVAEYRALRTSVLQLWLVSVPKPGPQDVQDIIRFNESIDQLLAESIAAFAHSVDSSRESFLGILGHDLRNPLSAAMMLAALLGEATELGPTSRKMAATLRSSLDAMNELVRDLLDFTGTRLGAKMVIFPQLMDLLPLCREVLEEIQTIHPTNRLILSPTIDTEVTGEWDASRLRQLISNLLGNAIQHGLTTTPVTLTIETAGTNVRLAVHNHGPSIPKEKLDFIFDPLKQHRPSGESSPLGSIGLGLYIAREVANTHGGAINVTSDSNETTFTVELPRHPPGDRRINTI
jgi:signal transduction histidine kinase